MTPAQKFSTGALVHTRDPCPCCGWPWQTHAETCPVLAIIRAWKRHYTEAGKR